MSGVSDLIPLDSLGITPTEYLLIKRAGDLLEQHYPGHGWMVGINGGVMDIKPMSLNTGRMVYTVKHVDSYSASDLDKRVLNAGGAWLEVLRQRRGAANHDALSGLKTDRLGQHIPEL